MSTLTEIQVSRLGTAVLRPTDGKFATVRVELEWPEDRYLIGWSPWIGYGHGSVLESHLILLHDQEQLFVRGPHKESGAVMYDEAQIADFFPAGTGRLVKAGEKVALEFLVVNIGTPPAKMGGQANARIFSVVAQTAVVPQPTPSPTP